MNILINSVLQIPFAVGEIRSDVPCSSQADRWDNRSSLYKEERMNSTYKKEVRYTLIFSALLLMSGHLGLVFVAFPGLQGHMIFGFPSQYIIPVVMGWLGLMIIVAVQAKLTNDLDDEIELLSGTDEKA